MVFVSYRREDSGLVAIDIARELGELIEGQIFFDLGSIGIGKQFNDEIATALQRASVVLVLLGRGWAGLVGGARRIDDEQDVFRQEIETALASSAVVIPVLLGDMTALSAADLPESLQPLAHRQWHRIRLENKWEAIRALAEVVRNTVEEQRFRRIYEGVAESSRYKMLFDPRQNTRPTDERRDDPFASMVWPDDVVFRVNVALATERVLVVVGPDGSPRDSLAFSIAATLRWRAYSFAYSAARTPKDLVYAIDETRRLADAQAAQMRQANVYVEPGVLWWAFDPASARRRGAPPGENVPEAFDPARGSAPQSSGAVLLFSGDPPKNVGDYLLPFESREFVVQEMGIRVRAENPVLVVLSTSDVRSVERWIRQRGVVCYLRPPSRDEMMAIARRVTNLHPRLIEAVIEQALALQEAAGRPPMLDQRAILDVLRAVKALHIDVADRNWRALLDALMPA
jgi:MoxR-like ATPase